MAVKLSTRTKKAMFDILGRYGYRSEREFIEDALRHRILELKKTEFLRGARKIREILTKKGLREENILKDFDKFYHRR